jgi:hypothetical protein
MAGEFEIAREILAPHFDAVKDVYAAFCPEPGHAPLARAAETKFVIDPKQHDTERHFAACRDDGLKMIFAPQIVDLPVDTLVAILAHEFGHALDFLYPGHWVTPPRGPGLAVWIGDPSATKQGRAWRKLWEDRDTDRVEWAADGIAQAVTGKKLGYCGPCMLQCFAGGVERPEGLR